MNQKEICQIIRTICHIQICLNDCDNVNISVIKIGAPIAKVPLISWLFIIPFNLVEGISIFGWLYLNMEWSLI